MMGDPAQLGDRDSGSPAGIWRWWGSHEVPREAIARWRIGPASIYAQRLPGEWRLARATSEDPFDSHLSIELATDDVEDLLAFDDVTRFGLDGDDATLHLTPLLADRPVISRPQRPFILPAGGATTLYVSTPLWLRIEAGPARALLAEFPIFRPSDTWFGPSTLDGDLCYASRAFFTIQLQRQPLRPHRAVTGVHVENRAATPLEVQHLNLPTPHLRLYQRPEDDGTLWTDDVVFARTDTGDFVELAPGAAWRRAPEGAELTTPARIEPSSRTVFRAFSSFFHLGE